MQIIEKIGFAENLETACEQIKNLYLQEKFKAITLISKDQFIQNEFIYYCLREKHADAEICPKIALSLELNPELNKNCGKIQLIISKNKNLKKIPLLAIIFLKKGETEI